MHCTFVCVCVCISQFEGVTQRNDFANVFVRVYNMLPHVCMLARVNIREGSHLFVAFLLEFRFDLFLAATHGLVFEHL